MGNFLDTESTQKGTPSDKKDSFSPSSKFIWPYRWTDGINTAVEVSFEPRLTERLAQLLLDKISSNNPRLYISIKGELGSGKSTLSNDLSRMIQDVLANKENLQDVSKLDRLRNLIILEAIENETADEFSKKINNCLDSGADLIALARPNFMEYAEGGISFQSDVNITLTDWNPFSPMTLNLLSSISTKNKLNTEASERVREIVSNLPSFMRTPFWFEQAAAIFGSSDSPTPDVTSRRTPIELFIQSIQSKISKTEIEQLQSCFFGECDIEDTVVHGILEGNKIGHDGYKNLLVAAAIIEGRYGFLDIFRVSRSVDATRILLQHVVYRAKSIGTVAKPEEQLLKSLIKYVEVEPDFSINQHALYTQALVTDSLRKTPHRGKYNSLVTLVRERCLAFVKGELSAPTGLAQKTIWWDISDSLSLVGDSRLVAARDSSYSSDCGYFTHIPKRNILVGTDHKIPRLDDAKPVLSYKRSTVSIGPFWVANFLVTNEEFNEFRGDSEREHFYEGTGRQWFNKSSSTIDEIGRIFDLAARRNLWKELEEDPEAVTQARERVTCPNRPALCDPRTGDDRYSAPGNPVVGINWWDAMAYCNWWSKRKFNPESFGPGNYRVCLLTDWEWEAVRRIYLEEQISDGEKYDENRFSAHLRDTNKTKLQRDGFVRRPLHVGLFSNEGYSGPLDLVGNVWEWTRSRVLGRIEECEDDLVCDSKYGNTIWNHVNESQEVIPDFENRDTFGIENDFSYRAVRGGSYFSKDPQAAWHPAYRLCDPPFADYPDLSFRIAIYPT